MDKDDDRSMNLKQASVVPEASELVRRYSDEPYSNVHHPRQYYNISPQSSVGPKELLESQSSNGDQPLDFSRKSSSVRRVPVPIVPVRREIISPISPARSEPPSQFLSYGDKYPKVVSIGHSPQSDGSGDDGHFVSHPDSSVGVFPPDVAARVNHNRMEAYRLQALYHETFQNHETNLSALNTAGLLTTVPAMAPQNTRQASGEVPHKKPKYTRPFKAYPRDTHSIAAAAAAAASMGFYNGIHIPGQISLSPVNHMSNAANDPAFLQFRQEMLAARQADSQRKQRHSGEIHSEGSNDSDHKSSIVASSSVNEGLMNYNARISTDSQDNSACSIDTKMCNNVGTASNSHSPDPVNRDNGNNGHGIVPMIMNGQMPNSSRKRSRALPDDLKDEAYWERRRKNNEAAKRSRDARRAKEDEIAIRAAYLERENLRLRLEVQTLRKELMEIRHMIYANERRPNS